MQSKDRLSDAVMDKVAANHILRDRLERYRRLSYEDLRQLLGSVQIEAIVDSTGVSYQIEVQFFWDDRPNGDIRVIGCIDDGGLRAFVPLSDSFIKAPSGAFVGE